MGDVGLVVDGDYAGVGGRVVEADGAGGGRVDDVEDDSGGCERESGAFDAEPLDGVVGVSYTCGIDEAEEEFVDFECVFDGVACCAVDVAYDGAFFAEEGIEERGFSGVGGSGDGYGYSIFDGRS